MPQLHTFKPSKICTIYFGGINIDILSEVTFAQEYLNMLSELGFTSYINDSCAGHRPLFCKT